LTYYLYSFIFYCWT